MSQFLRRIEFQKDDCCVATLPADERSKGWDILHKIQDHVVTIYSSGRTQLIVSPNEGYDYAEAVAILAVVVYAAKNGLEELLTKHSMREHLNALNKDCVMISILEEVPFEYYLTQYFNFYVRQQVERAFNEITTGYRLDYLDKMKVEVIKAKRALEFVPFTSLTLTPWEKSRRIKTINLVIGEIDELKKEGFILNGDLQRRMDGSKTALHIFYEYLVENPLAIGGSLAEILRKAASIAQINSFHFGIFNAKVKGVLARAEEAIALTPLTCEE